MALNRTFDVNVEFGGLESSPKISEEGCALFCRYDVERMAKVQSPDFSFHPNESGYEALSSDHSASRSKREFWRFSYPDILERRYQILEPQ